MARKTRCKKRAELELLREQVNQLQGENDKLKLVMESRLDMATPCIPPNTTTSNSTNDLNNLHYINHANNRNELSNKANNLKNVLDFNVQLPTEVINKLEMIMTREEQGEMSSHSFLNNGIKKCSKNSFCEFNSVVSFFYAFSSCFCIINLLDWYVNFIFLV